MASQDDELLRTDETQFRLLEWTQQQAPSERLAAQILDAEGYKDIDPSHPLGGKDGGRDGHCTKDGKPWTWAVYFPRGQQDLKTIETKLSGDIEAARKHNPNGVAFVTNQELKLAERTKLRSLGGDLEIDLFHLERVATILDRPRMHSVRQQYLKFGAGRPPVQVKAEVIGAARVFTDDDELLDRFVEIFEKDVREVSDKAWAKVRAEEEGKRRAEEERARARAERARARAEKAAGEAHEAHQRANPQTLAGLAGQGSVPAFQRLAAGIKIEDILPKLEIPKYDFGLDLGQYGLSEKQAPPPKPLSDEEIEQKVAHYRAGLEARWESCKEYLAAVAWPGLKFRIQNDEGFLTNLQVVLWFHGARGLDYERIETFVWEKAEDPSWTEPYDPYRSTMRVAPLLANNLKDYPVKWEHNDDGDLVVKITLAELRPHEVWSSDDDDIVLMLRDESLEAVDVTYTITAYEHHDRPDGEPFAVPIEKVDAFDSINAAFDATNPE